MSIIRCLDIDYRASHCAAVSGMRCRLRFVCVQAISRTAGFLFYNLVV